MQNSDLYVHEGNFTHVQGGYRIAPRLGFNVDSYLHGRCHLAAMMLAKETALELMILIDENTFIYDGPSGLTTLLHAACKVDDVHVLDARGVFRLDEMLDEYARRAIEPRFIFAEEALGWIEKSVAARSLAPLALGEEQALLNYIDKLKSKGLISPRALENSDISCASPCSLHSP